MQEDPRVEGSKDKMQRVKVKRAIVKMRRGKEGYAVDLSQVSEELMKPLGKRGKTTCKTSEVKCGSENKYRATGRVSQHQTTNRRRTVKLDCGIH